MVKCALISGAGMGMMHGKNFNNHPDLRRVYMPEEFKYHPLRKDFPLMGIPGSLPLPKK